MSHSYYPINGLGKQFLVRWLEQGISRFREATEVPQNLISAQTVERTCEAVSEELLTRTAEDLGVASSSSLYEAAHSVPDLDVAMSTMEAQNAMQQWVVRHQPLLILQALAKAVSKLTPSIIEDKVQDSRRTIRVLFVLALAPFCSSSAELLLQFGGILNCQEPHRMIKKFTGIAMRGESETIQKIDHIILSSSQWREWSPWFMKQGECLAPQCWGRLVVSGKPGDPSSWNAMWDSLFNDKEVADGN